MGTVLGPDGHQERSMTARHAAKCVRRFRWRRWESWVVMAWIRRKGLSCVEVFRRVGVKP